MTALLRAAAHPLADQIEIVRAAILAADASITEVVKWNAPSFRTTVDFATVHLRARDEVLLVLHTGAKAGARKRPTIADPSGLIERRADDRCLVHLGADVRGHRVALTAIVRAWIRAL